MTRSALLQRDIAMHKRELVLRVCVIIEGPLRRKDSFWPNGSPSMQTRQRMPAMRRFRARSDANGASASAGG